MIGHLNGKHNQLNKIFKTKLSDAPLSVRNYLGDGLGIQYYYRHPRNYNRRGIFSIDEPSPTIRGVNRPIPAGYRLNSGDPKGVSLHEIRSLTTLERSYIQTFPTTFIFEGTKTALEQMIGNAVPVNLAKFVAEAIKFYLENGSQLGTAPIDSGVDFKMPGKELRRTPNPPIRAGEHQRLY